jgi:hypothetical protein
LKPFEGSG